MQKSRAFPGAWSDIESLSSGSLSMHHASTSPGTKSPLPALSDTFPSTTPAVGPSPMSSCKALEGWERWSPIELKDYVLETFPDDELSVEELAVFISSHKVHSQLIVRHIDEIDVICETEKEREMLRAITRSLLRVIKSPVRAHTSRPGLGAIFPDISNVVSTSELFSCSLFSFALTQVISSSSAQPTSGIIRTRRGCCQCGRHVLQFRRF